MTLVKPRLSDVGVSATFRLMMRRRERCQQSEAMRLRLDQQLAKNAPGSASIFVEEDRLDGDDCQPGTMQ